jgi:ribosomal protein S18 acetylase RimI-like enzyme
MAELAQTAYWDTALSDLLSPLRGTYPEDHQYWFQNRIKGRMLSPRNRGFVAIGDGDVVGYMMCARLGDDEGALKVQKEKRTWWMGAAELGWGVYGKTVKLVWPDRSQSDEGLAEFMKATVVENEKHWKGREDRKNRWYVQSVVVAEAWRGRGVGKKLMAWLMEQAQKEGVVIGLEASMMGERLYRSIGFDLLGRFVVHFEATDDEHGGIMMWSPK